MINADKLEQEIQQHAEWDNQPSSGPPDEQIDHWAGMADPGAASYSDAASVSTISSRDSDGNENKNKVKTRYSTTYKNDKGYFKIKRGNTKEKLTGFGTPYHPGATIRNACTGFYENDYMGNAVYKVGSKEEDLFFKVSFSECGISNEPRCLFYDNPEQCERHLKTNIADDVKKRWSLKYNTAIEFERIEKDKQDRRNNPTVEVR